MTTRSTDLPPGGSLPDRGHVERVYARLRDAILRGDMAPGLAIRQEQLARDLEVSRTPLREALRKLEYEGLVESGPKRLYRVTEFSISEYEDLFMARIPLEAIAMRLTVPALDTRDIAELEGDMAQMAHFARGEDWELWNGPHRSFHSRLVAKAGSRTRDLLAQLIDHSTRYWGHYMPHRALRLAWGVEAHRAILDACIEGDIDLAVRLEVEHLVETAVTLIGMVDAEYSPVGLRIAASMAHGRVDSGTLAAE